MNPILNWRTLGHLVAVEAQRLHIVGASADLRVVNQPATDDIAVFVDGRRLIDVPVSIELMEVDAARGLIQNLLLAQAYPNGL